MTCSGQINASLLDAGSLELISSLEVIISELLASLLVSSSELVISLLGTLLVIVSLEESGIDSLSLVVKTSLTEEVIGLASFELANVEQLDKITRQRRLSIIKRDLAINTSIV